MKWAEDTFMVPASNSATPNESPSTDDVKSRAKRRGGHDDGLKRRCVSTACVACRRRKSKCDGNTPACAACSSVYGTECVYDPKSDHRRKGVYWRESDLHRTGTNTLQILLRSIIDWPEEDAFDLVRQIRATDNLDDVAAKAGARGKTGFDDHEDDERGTLSLSSDSTSDQPNFASHLSAKMGELRLEDGSTRYIGGTSHLIHISSSAKADVLSDDGDTSTAAAGAGSPITSWTTVTSDPDLVMHLLNLYFTWHYPYFTTLSKSLFFLDFLQGKDATAGRRAPHYCTPLLVNAMLALGCHFTSHPLARADPADSATAGDHFFKEAKRLVMMHDEHENPRLPTVQAFGLMSVREAGCGREAKGWVYSGMSLRMACDLGLNLDPGTLNSLDEAEEDARRITFWGCFLFDTCWSNYLGRLPQLRLTNITVPKIDVFPVEDAETWSPLSDFGYSYAHAQPARTRTVARHISALCEISNDLMIAFYNPIDLLKPKGKQAELQKLGEIHQRLEAWRRNIPKELEPREGALPNALVMFMFFHILYIHLFRPFLKYNETTSPLPAHVSPRKHCTLAATMISKLLRIYKKSYGLRQICNISVYIVHSACTVHLLNLPERSAKRDIIHGVRQLEEIAESWLCARRSLAIIDVLARKWDIEMPEEASTVLQRCIAKFGSYAESYKTGQGSKARSRSDVHVSSPAIKVESSDSYVAADQSALQETPVQGLSTFAFSRPLAPQDNRSPVSLTSQMAADFPFMSNRSILDSNGQVSLPSGEITAGQPVMGITPTSSNEPYRYNDGQLTAGHDWCLNDQSQYATGFGNWELIDPAAGPQWISNLPQTSEAAIDMDFGLKSAPLDPSWPMAGFSVLGNLAAYDEKAFGSTAACLSSAPM